MVHAHMLLLHSNVSNDLRFLFKALAISGQEFHLTDSVGGFLILQKGTKSLNEMYESILCKC